MKRTTWEASQLEERIDRIVTLAATYPEAASRVARRFIAEEGRLACFSLVCESIGIEYARVIFDSLPEYAWDLLDAPLRTPIPLERALDAFSRELLAECMEEPEQAAAEARENPFAFLIGAKNSRLEAILRPHAVEKIALIASYLSRSEMALVAAALSPESAKRLVMTVSRLHRIPRAVSKEQARRFSNELLAAWKASALDWAISEIDLERELELLTEARGESQALDEILKSMPSSEPIRDVIESARQKMSG